MATLTFCVSERWISSSTSRGSRRGFAGPMEIGYIGPCSKESHAVVIRPGYGGSWKAAPPKKGAPMQRITPCLWFDGRAEEAAEFYTSIFKNSRIGRIARYGETGPGAPGSVMTVNFEIAGQEFMGLNGGPQFQFSPAISFVVYCKNQRRSTTTGTGSSRAASPRSAAGSPTSSACPGRSCRPRCPRCSRTRTRHGPARDGGHAADGEARRQDAQGRLQGKEGGRAGAGARAPERPASARKATTPRSRQDAGRIPSQARPEPCARGR